MLDGGCEGLGLDGGCEGLGLDGEREGLWLDGEREGLGLDGEREGLGLDGGCEAPRAQQLVRQAQPLKVVGCEGSPPPGFRKESALALKP